MIKAVPTEEFSLARLKLAMGEQLQAIFFFTQYEVKDFIIAAFNS